ATGGALSAARLAASAATIADDAGAALDALDARLLQARALAAAGRTDAAKEVLQRITVDAAHRHAFRLRDAAARELRALGTRVASAGQRASGGALTDREREITALVAAGRSNRQVADTLFLSEKTVANALTRIYAKVGVRTRAQLARSHAV
ncbi:helix-turn-helix transcriptional regulator, partial [Solirubrobacter taibaiensis]|nr:helix-turn-helix transcriptional regulator [Solirubrobacter taibaiensis]